MKQAIKDTVSAKTINVFNFEYIIIIKTGKKF